jgi:hypothetical protein
VRGKILFIKLMMRLKIQRVNSVPPIPTMIIVIPKVRLSIFGYLLFIKVSYLKSCPLYHPGKGFSIKKVIFLTK